MKHFTFDVFLVKIWLRNRLAVVVVLQLIFCNSLLLAQSSKPGTTISGTVSDATTGELLSGAVVVITGANHGTTANNYGFYSYSVPRGHSEVIEIRFVSYTPIQFRYSFSADTIANVRLKPKSTILDALIITDESQQNIEIPGAHVLTAASVRDIASFAGESDAIKAFQFMPGVQTGNEGTINLSVRGGTMDQNLFVLDDATVYNPSHALSFFSVFNTSSLKEASLFKGPIPVRFGGRLSSVVQVTMKEGNRNVSEISGSVGTIASGLTAEGPLIKGNDAWSYMLSGRASYAGLVLNGIYFLGQNLFRNSTANNSTTDNKIGFFDLNGKINYRRSARDHFFLSAYSGGDQFYFNHITNGYALNWGNNTVTFRWNHVHGSRVFSNTTGTFSRYAYKYSVLNNTQYFLWQARLQQGGIKQDYDFYANSRHHLTFGWGFELYDIMPGSVEPRSDNAPTRTLKMDRYAPLAGHFYVGNSQRQGNFLLNYGVRYSNFINTKRSTQYYFESDANIPSDSTLRNTELLYQRLEPRVSITWNRPTAIWTVSYDRTAQYLHLLANSSVGLPTDIWLPSTASITPQLADIYAFEFRSAKIKRLTPSASVYYKSLQNVVDFKDNAMLFVNKYVESQLRQGIGRSYGIEVSVNKSTGPFRGQLSYTLSRSTLTINGVNGGKMYSSRYDKRHNLAFTGKYDLSRKFSFSANFVFTSGGAITLPVGNFTFDNVVFNYYEGRNSYRLPVYHRLDVAVKYVPPAGREGNFRSYWTLDVYNLYGRKNPFTVYSLQSDYGFNQVDVKALYLFGVVPTVNYHFTWNR